MILALAGGVGGAKLAAGLARVLPPGELLVAVNTADDFEHLGLHISPDLDTVMYNLAGCHNPQAGWGVAGDTWEFMASLQKLGGDHWFRLGDRDLATHVERTRRLRSGESLTRITDDFCQALGIRQRVVPMSEDAVRTIVHTDGGRLAFQDYFVRLRCEPQVVRIEFDGAGRAAINPALDACLADAQLRAVIICPSNPYLSVAPMLAMPGLRARMAALGAPVIAVSPIVGGHAIKGPAAKLMMEMGVEPSALAIARHYAGLIDVLVVDRVDAALAPAVSALGMRCLVLDTVMRTEHDRERLADEILRTLAP